VNAADWIMVVVILLSVLHAMSAGFFQEAFWLAGLVFGYLLAAWNFQRLAQGFAPYLKPEWLGEIAAFLIIFLAVMIVAGIAGRPLDHEGSWVEVCGSCFGRSTGVVARLSDRGRGLDEYDSVHAHIEVAGGFEAGALFPGRRTCRHLGGTAAVAGAFL